MITPLTFAFSFIRKGVFTALVALAIFADVVFLFAVCRKCASWLNNNRFCGRNLSKLIQKMKNHSLSHCS